MNKNLVFTAFLCASQLVQAQTGAASALTEQDFLVDMPIVLSVSRLAQRQDETPGAVTILDRHFIRATGARDLVDVLRLVPGFQTTSSFETDAPMASYHGRSDDWANRIQVLVDGRSVYSGFLLGSAGLGWQTLALDDIERIEILRGSNSATYGARAFLGVVSIISRDVRETQGVSANLTAGENGVADLGASVGWGDATHSYRLSADSRGDDGLRKVFSGGNHAAGTNRTSRVNLASHLSPGGQNEIDLRIGASEIAAIRGDALSWGNAERLRFLTSRFLQADWKKTLSEAQDVLVSASHTDLVSNDSFPLLDPDYFGTPYYGIAIESKAREFNDVVSVQHTVRQSAQLSTVWGAELRREQLISRTSFDSREQVSSNFYRLFGSAQWHVQKNLVLNLGALQEYSDLGGSSFAPRAMLNWQAGAGHTLRAGVSGAFRPPSAFEKYGALRYYDINGANPTPWYYTGNPQLTPEKIWTQELGYYGNFPAVQLSADLRLYSEHITDAIGVRLGRPVEFANGDDSTINGAEFQLAWKPASATQLFFNQSWTDIQVSSMVFGNVDEADWRGLAVKRDAEFRMVHGAPKYAASLTLMHTLNSGEQLTLMHQRAEEFALSSENTKLFSMGRTDLRFAKPFKLVKSKAEVAATIQNLDVPYRDGDKKFFFDRRAMVSLRIEN